MLKLDLEKVKYYILIIFAFFAPFETVLQMTFNIPGFIKLYYIFTAVCIFIICLYPKKLLLKISMDKTFMMLFLMFVFWIFISVVINIPQSDMIVGYYKEKSGAGFYGPEIRSFMIGFVRTTITFLYISVLFLFTNTPKCRLSVLKGLLAIAVTTSLYSLYQFAGFFLNLPFTTLFLHNTELRPEGTFTFGLRRVEGVFQEPGPQATFLAPFLILFFFILLSKNKLIKNKAVNIIMMILFLIVLFLTLSPIAFISIFVAALLYLIFNFKEILKAKFIKCLAYIIVPVILSLALISGVFIKNFANIDFADIMKYYAFKLTEGTFTLSNDPFVYSNYDLRSVKAYSGMQMFFHNPLFGVGLGNSDLIFFKYLPFAVFSPALPALNSQYVLILAETGIIGFILFSLILFYPVYLYWKKRRLVNKSPNKFYYQGLVISYMTIFIVSFHSEPYFWMSFFWLFYVLAVQSLRFINQDGPQTASVKILEDKSL